MKDEIIVVDIDGVLADFSLSFTALMSRRSDEKTQSTRFQQTWRFEDSGYSKESVKDAWDYIDGNPSWWTALIPIPSRLEFSLLRELETHYTVVYLTNRHETDAVRDATQDWLNIYRIKGGLVFTSDKAAWCSSRNVVGIIEDKPANIDAMNNAGLPVHCRQWEYNKDCAGMVVTSLGEFCNIYLASNNSSATTKPSNPKDIVGSDKVPIHLWPPTATAMGSMALMDGALKYGRTNWRVAGVRWSIYYDALMRHTFALFEGEDIDPDSGLPHEAHILACAAILVDAKAAGKLTDDRMVKGGYRGLIDSLTTKVAAMKAKHADKAPKHYDIRDSIGDNI